MRPDTAPYSFHRREGIFYVQFRDQASRKWTTPNSTGTKDKNTALLTIPEWMRDAIPQYKTDMLRISFPDLFQYDAIIEAIRKAQMAPEEAREIVGILKERAGRMHELRNPGSCRTGCQRGPQVLRRERRY
jgi:hypothetical protein